MEETDPSIIERQTNEVEPKTDPDAEDSLHIPDGGWGWVVCFAGFMANITIFGLISSNGILVLGLTVIYDDSISKIAMVSSIFGGIQLCVGPFVLFLMMFNASHRQVIICGGFVSAVATFASFFVEQVDVLYVTYGIISGFFSGISYFSCNTIVGSYFKKKRLLATGIIHSGTGIGAFSFNYLIERSISFYGMRGTFLLISGFLLNIVVYGALCRPLKTFNMKNKEMKKIKLKSKNEFLLKPESGFDQDEKSIGYEEGTNANNFNDSKNCGHSDKGLPTNKTKRFSSKCTNLHKIIFDLDVMKNPGMQLLLTVYFFWAFTGPDKITDVSIKILRQELPPVLANFVACCLKACDNVLIYLPAKVVNVGLTREQGALIMSIYGAIIGPSQIITGILGDLLHIPVSYLLMPSLFGMSATTLAFTFCDSFPLLVLCVSVFSIFYGFTFTLRMVLVASILGGRNLTKGYSPLCLMIGLTYIIDTKIAGSLLDATQSYDSIFYFASVSLFMACIASSGIVYLQRKGKFHDK